MSSRPNHARRKGPPPHHIIGQSLYGEAFEATSATGLSESMADWSKLTEAERSFTLAHFLYLNLQSQGRVLLVQTRGVRLLSELSSDLADVMEMLTDPEESEPEDEGESESDNA